MHNRYTLLLISLCVAFGHITNPLVGLRSELEGVVREEIDASIFMSASPSVLKASGERVTVALRGVPAPSTGDIIALYSPANADPRTTSPIKYISGDQFGSGYLSSGSADVKFTVINLRSNFRFAFMRGFKDMQDNWDKFNSTVILAYSNVADFSNKLEPLQGHLALTGKPGQMKVMWGAGNKPSQQVLRVGSVPGVYNVIMPAKASTYKSSDLCGAPATTFGWRDPGLLYSATVSGLRGGKKYYYSYGSVAGGFSKVSSFVAPSIPSANSVLNLVAFGDMGKGEDDNSIEHWPYQAQAPETVKKIMAVTNDIDLVLHVGDISYAVGYSAQWDEFLEQIKPVASRVPWMTLPGNHERDFPNSGVPQNGTDSGGECGVPYYKRFPMPTPTPDQPWYSFESGPVHFVTMSTEHDFTVGSLQNRWIEKDLQSVNRSRTPWVVFSGHRPMYIDSTNDSPLWGDQTVAIALRQHVEPLLQKYKVDIAFWGHHHTYQRTCPVYQTKCAQGNTVHVVIGMAGFGLTHNLEKHWPSYMVYVDDTENGFTKIRVDAKSFKMEYFGNKSGLKDSFTLTK
eukprot:TRINITY_DN1866_c0_g1_i1.p1 TRINITY_DN1866_c0_g1~~TRINITY_DN1866_c0_g1_i1.p1  ORF type:complete len:569 (+),score=151.58 TRINITY_DN1866_c0_g1_i1:237-1943(+)